MATKDISDRQVCLAYEVYRDGMRRGMDMPYPYEILSIATGQAEKVCYRAMERTHRRGYTEYGVSLRTGWLTEKGKAFLQEAKS